MLKILVSLFTPNVILLPYFRWYPGSNFSDDTSANLCNIAAVTSDRVQWKHWNSPKLWEHLVPTCDLIVPIYMKVWFKFCRARVIIWCLKIAKVLAHYLYISKDLCSCGCRVEKICHLWNICHCCRNKNGNFPTIFKGNRGDFSWAIPRHRST